jgi:hypothetical protein
MQALNPNFKFSEHLFQIDNEILIVYNSLLENPSGPKFLKNTFFFFHLAVAVVAKAWHRPRLCIFALILSWRTEY